MYGNKEFIKTFYDPNTFILGTSEERNFQSKHKRNYAKTI